MWIKSQTGDLINSSHIERVFLDLESEAESHRVMVNMTDGKMFVVSEQQSRKDAERVLKQIARGVQKGSRFLDLG
jgi:hypothetical protein